MESQKKGKKGIDYSKGKIYRIVCDTTGLVYIGSTVETLSNRLSKHKNKYKCYLKGNTNFVTSFDILKNDNYKIILINNYPCNNKEELEREERKYIESIECVNKFIPGRTRKEYCEDNKEYIKERQKEYCETNKDKISEKRKIYYENNKNKIREKRKIYYENNESKIKERSKEYQSKNKDKIKENKKQKIECEYCKCITTKNQLKRHQKSLKCKKFQSLVIED
jgi:hypothetical protein